MPPADTVDQELLLKKRARRRLVGAVTLVLLLIIVLPFVLKDRVNITSNEHAKIVMNDDDFPEAAEPKFKSENESSMVDVVIDSKPAFIEPIINIDEKQVVDVITPQLNSDSQTSEKIIAKQEATAEVKPAKVSLENKAIRNIKQSAIAVKPTMNPTLSPQAIITQSTYTIQVGVFSDLNNMKNTESALIKAGFTTTTEKLLTPKGESIRLMTGSYSSRELANDALSKIKSIGLDGMIKSAERINQSKVN